MAKGLLPVGVVLIAVFYGGVVWSDNEDHPLLSRYPDSTLTRTEHQEFAEYRLVIGYDKDKKALVGPVLEGALTRKGYYNPRDRSVLELFHKYKQALTEAKAEILHECADTQCSPSYASSMWNRYNGISTFTPRNARYVAAKLTNSAGKTAYVAVMVGKNRHSIDVLELQSMEQGLVTLDADALGKGLDENGYIVVDGIFFDTNKAIVKPESKTALNEVAKLLSDRPGLEIFVVGHTDMTGSFSHNMALSSKRAKAVVDTLVKDYAIAGSRLEGHGIGPLAPQGTNQSDTGRTANRRVVLVAR